MYTLIVSCQAESSNARLAQVLGFCAQATAKGDAKPNFVQFGTTNEGVMVKTDSAKLATLFRREPSFLIRQF